MSDNSMARPDGPGSQATPGAASASPPIGFDPSRKFTFRKEPPTNGLAGVGRPYPNTEIKYGGRLCGHIHAPIFSTKDRKWRIGLMVLDADERIGWRWAFFMQRFEREADAREWLNANRAAIHCKWRLRFWDDRDSDRSGEASETPKSGSTEGESAGPKDIATPNTATPSSGRPANG